MADERCDRDHRGPRRARGHRGRPALLASLLGATLLGVALLAACAQTPVTTGPPEAQAPPPGGGHNTVAGPALGTVEVWLSEHGVMLWHPRLEQAGTYRFEVHNRGSESHDLTVVRWDGPPSALPQRSGRALLHGLEVLGQSPELPAGAQNTLDVGLDRAGVYVLLSSHGQDFGQGMATTLRVGSGAALATPLPTPDLRERSMANVYLLDHALLLSNDTVDAGLATLHVQNLGPSPHDLVLVRWRGDHRALPVDRAGHVMLDALHVLTRVDALHAGEELVLDVVLEDGYAYAAFSSLPGDYQAGMSGQLLVR